MTDNLECLIPRHPCLSDQRATHAEHDEHRQPEAVEADVAVVVDQGAPAQHHGLGDAGGGVLCVDHVLDARRRQA